MSGKRAKKANEINDVFGPDMAGHADKSPDVRVRSSAGHAGHARTDTGVRRRANGGSMSDDEKWQQAERERAIKMAIAELKAHGGTAAEIERMIEQFKKAAKEEANHSDSGRLEIPT